jgi:Protein of unknown function (DUF2798)
MKINPKYFHLVFSFVTSLIVAGIVTFVLTAINHGFTDFIPNWVHNFIIVWVVAFPSVFIVAPQVQRLLKRMMD